MTPSLRAALTGIALLALPGAACGEPPAGEARSPAPPTEQAEPPVQAGVVVELELLDAARAPQGTFAASAPIHLALALHNRGGEAMTLGFASGRTHDAVIERADGSVVWRWSDGRQFIQMLTSLQIGPGERTRFELACDPAAAGYPALEPGAYRAVALVPAFAGELRSKPVPFRIAGD